ncbi:putative mitochondrial protein, conserved [Linnemannia gamsii]|uniref:Succinate dehydrogenase assembly factor 4, mitochondrial n=1 Tax=Linnemannia gamsii TaxID=64522 RepID=A0A9P6UGZ3_9FUNG|nr:putative mitochondrial protein, conserved [Linnemannia gamsii]
MSALITSLTLKNPLPATTFAVATTTITARAYSKGLRPRGPGPIPLESAKDQAEFEQLVKNAASTPATSHPDAKTPVPDEFQGDTNPTTGEVGGPKREPVRFGDWSFKGRVTDF